MTTDTNITSLDITMSAAELRRRLRARGYDKGTSRFNAAELRAYVVKLQRIAVLGGRYELATAANVDGILQANLDAEEERKEREAQEEAERARHLRLTHAVHCALRAAGSPLGVSQVLEALPHTAGAKDVQQALVRLQDAGWARRTAGADGLPAWVGV